MPKKQRVKETAEEQSVATRPMLRANVNRVLKQSENFFSVYVNDAQLQSTPWDVRIIFGVIVGLPTEEGQPIDIAQLGEVRLSPQLAKKLTMVLIQQLKDYEQRLGPIPLPQD